MRQPWVVGNWKMNGGRASNSELLAGISAGLQGPNAPSCRVAVCPPSIYLSDVSAALEGSRLQWGGQDVSAHEKGAYTGEISAGMLREFGCSLVIVGHSERRQYHAEDAHVVAAKADAALRQGLTPIVCVGETLAEHDAGLSFAVVQRQLAVVNLRLGERVGEVMLAYEPIWAIGTGRTATPEQAQSVHAVLRAQLSQATNQSQRVPILYGGSVKPENAAELFAQPDIDGGLIGGAALKSADFLAVCRAAT
jgi:triosephosphate isomerase